MRRTTSLQKLLALREARSQRAETALARQHSRCEAARADVDAATTRVVAHRTWQQERERELLKELLGRPATVNHIERVRAAFAAIDAQSESLEHAEQAAGQTMRTALELKQALLLDRNQRRREQDKMSSLVARGRSAALRRRELFTEVEQEERVRGTSADRSWPC
jgi:Type III secretion protein YscO